MQEIEGVHTEIPAQTPYSEISYPIFIKVVLLHLGQGGNVSVLSSKVTVVPQ